MTTLNQLTTTPPSDVAADGQDSDQAAVAQKGDNKCVSVIFNPVSGKTNPEERMRVISAALSRHGYTCQFIATSKETGAKELAKQALEDGVDLIAVSGGDGTVMEVLSALVGTDVPVAVLPAGTGNLLSANLGIPVTVPEAVDVALSGLPYRLDLARSEDRYFAIMGGIGLDGKVIEEADREAKNRLGIFAYFVATIRNLGRHRTSVLIRLDDKPPLRRRVKSVLIANMGKMTGGFEAIPTASPTDGMLDIGVVKARTTGQWLRLLGYSLLGRAQESPDLEVYQARRVSITAIKPQPVQFDGEEGGRRRELNAEVVPGAVVVLVPENASAARDANELPALVARRSAGRRLLAVGGAVLVIGAVGVWLARRRREKSDVAP
ncbi:MAG: diacylglycerol kinase family protein [Armatimonadota bacterium]